VLHEWGKANCVTHTTGDMLMVICLIRRHMPNIPIPSCHGFIKFQDASLKRSSTVAIEGCTVPSVLAQVNYWIMEVATEAATPGFGTSRCFFASQH